MSVDLTDETFFRLKIKGLEERISKLEAMLLAMSQEQLRQKIARKKAIEAAQAKKAAAAKQLSLI